MSISSTTIKRRELPLHGPHGGSGSLFFDPLTRTVSALAPGNQSPGKSPFRDSGLAEPSSGAADAQAAETTSKEHLKTELQSLSNKAQEIYVKRFNISAAGGDAHQTAS